MNEVLLLLLLLPFEYYQMSFVCGHPFQRTRHQPGMVTNPTCGQLTEQGIRLGRNGRIVLRNESRQKERKKERTLLVPKVSFLMEKL